MESIKDIIKEMRSLATTRDWHNHANQSNRERVLDFADRIEQAVTNCNQLKARKALEEILAIVKVHNRALISTRKTMNTIEEIIKQVLSSPARNCDLYSHEEALRIWSSLPESKDNGCFDDWLLAEAKGETK